ncbi:UDP-3-O-acylglucosamine N-acyltransferase [Thiosulfatimonas sediminis]|uniref:UDP-3-O-acylglucosamine N-acyltransferase n=1 Tax=Thiosulfatimonas sediminis TaxID=2675054 RepID=A0A6F8PUU3_9GAMM|nr:UDP-3-O-(3-hydroxymyristoyl)glucosamine N-acyltransferase [Thiosulfatimonas sediminis]BBP45901.1 UDP-3-O-acylglucosamine N-acyltransferase [Thiosulfatimonas sediminis]
MRIDSLLEVLDQHQVKYHFNGDATKEIHSVASLDNASAESLSFLNSPKFVTALSSTQAGLVILSEKFVADCPQAFIAVQDPYYVYSLLAQVLYPVTPPFLGVADNATVSLTAKVADNICVEANCVLQDNVVVGEYSWLAPGCVLYPDVQIGKHCRIGANVVIHKECRIGDYVQIESGTVIGGDGFGWAPQDGKWSKIPQIGRVIIGNHVAIGNNCTIDRGAIEDTIIEDHCIIDNLVHIAHNVLIGEGSAIAGQVGFAGTTQLGKYNIVAGQVGFAGHLSTVDHCHFAAKSGVTHNINQPGSYSGFPTQETSKWQKQIVRQRTLDKLARQVAALQKQIAEIE